MNDALHLQISAFVDGELPDNETELLIRRLSQDQALREQVADYLRIGRLIRGDREVAGMDHLRGRIQAALSEQPVEAPSASDHRVNRFLRPVAGVAVASVVAAAALLGLRHVNVPGADQAPVVAEQGPVPTVAANPGYTEPQPSEVLDNRPSELLMQYYLSHGASSRDLGANGILTRLVTLELSEGELVEAVPLDRDGARGHEREAKDVRADPPKE